MRRRFRLGRQISVRLRESLLNVAAVALLILLIVIVWNAVSMRGVKISAADAAAMRAPAAPVLALAEMAERANADFAEVLALYMLDNGFFRKAVTPVEDKALQTRYIDGRKSLRRRLGAKAVETYAAWFRLMLDEIACFPVQGVGFIYGDSFGAATANGMYTSIDIYDRERTEGRLRVVSMARGVVTETGCSNADGWYVLVRTAAGTVYRYAHLAYLSADIAAGTVVAAGSTLGYMGDTGTDGLNALLPVRLAVSVCVDVAALPAQTKVNPYIFLRLVETDE